MSEKIPGSFRDPSGFLFVQNGTLFRQINNCYKEDYDALMGTGVYEQLVKKSYLISHQEVPVKAANATEVYKIIKPEKLAFISYPYEWSFSQIKDAALLTLDIQLLALGKNLSLKDASAYNIQFRKGRPILIDTLSFERLKENQPWVAYRQFCQHFLAPLALMAKTDVSLNQLFCTNIDGVPLSLASRLLPLRAKCSFTLFVHLYLHAKSQLKNAGKGIHKKTFEGTFSKNAFIALIDNLKTAIDKLRLRPEHTEWIDYYDENNNYEKKGLVLKENIIEKFMQKVQAIMMTWDLGANTGRFSRIAAKYSKMVCAWDMDPACVEANYLQIKKNNEKSILPLLLNLATPSPAIGWNNTERMSLRDRGPADMILALGLIHHLAISNNLPLDTIAHFLHGLTHYLIIEFVPKSDSQVIKLLQSRDDIFPNYDQENFETVFKKYFIIKDRKLIPGTKRMLYLLKKIPVVSG